MKELMAIEEKTETAKESTVDNTAQRRGLVNGKRLLDELFDQQSRPSAKWLERRTADRTIPFLRIGRLKFYDLETVRNRLDRKNMVRAV